MLIYPFVEISPSAKYKEQHPSVLSANNRLLFRLAPWLSLYGFCFGGNFSHVFFKSVPNGVSVLDHIQQDKKTGRRKKK